MRQAQNGSFESPTWTVPASGQRAELKPGRGPCHVLPEDQYVAVPTNRHGPLQLHPCSGMGGWCPAVFVLSERHGWVDVKGELRQRLEMKVEEAIELRVPGFAGNKKLA